MGQQAAIRDWARSNGFQVADRGRIPRRVLDAYQAAQQGSPSTAVESGSAAGRRRPAPARKASGKKRAAVRAAPAKKAAVKKATAKRAAVKKASARKVAAKKATAKKAAAKKTTRRTPRPRAAAKAS